jgi:ParB-like chromosome segregation protein Spo0J
MNIEERKLTDIHPYEKNPRRNDDAVKYLVESIKEFGFKVPIVIDRDGVIVAGHTRYKAAKELGMETVPCIVADDLTDKQIKAFRLADNKVAEKSGWDFALLDQELPFIELDMEAFGFDEQEDLDIDDFFEEAEHKEKEPKRIQCPHCGEWFEK